MSSQALAGVLAGLTITLALVAVALAVERHRVGRRHEDRLDAACERAYRDRLASDTRWTSRLEERERAARAAERDAARTRLESAERKIEELELELARRRHGPLEEGELVALTTPDDRTIKGIVRQTFDNGAVLLGGAVVYVEETRRDGTVTVREERAGDVGVPAHVWAQKLPPEPLAVDQED